MPSYLNAFEIKGPLSPSIIKEQRAKEQRTMSIIEHIRGLLAGETPTPPASKKKGPTPEERAIHAEKEKAAAAIRENDQRLSKQAAERFATVLCLYERVVLIELERWREKGFRCISVTTKRYEFGGDAFLLFFEKE